MGRRPLELDSNNRPQGWADAPAPAPGRSATPSTVSLPDVSPETPVIDFLVGRFPHVPRQEWERRLTLGLVYDDTGTPLSVDARCAGHARLHYYRESTAEPVVPFDEEVLAVEDDFAVVYKPPFLPVTPGGAYVTACLLHRLREHLDDPGLVPVHRLDRDTSGVALFARNAAAAAELGAQFKAQQVERRYEAVGRAVGEVGSTWQVANRLGQGEPWFRMAVVSGAPNAWTDIACVQQTGARAHYTLQPQSGRKHQLRLHMASIGAAILNDRYYPDLQPEAPVDPLCPLQLAAVALGFTLGSRAYRFVAPRARLVEQLGGSNDTLRAWWSAAPA